MNHQRLLTKPWLDNLPIKRTTNSFWLGRGFTDPTSMGILFEASKSEAREATRKKDAPCSTSVFKSEGGGGDKMPLRSFFADVILAEGMKLKLLFFAFFFCGQQHPVPGFNYFRKSTVILTYTCE